MYTKTLLSALSGLALVRAQSEATANPTIPAIPTSTAGIPTIEGALVYEGPPVIGYTGPGGNATEQSGLPAATYQAVLPPTMFDNATGTVISGTVSASSVAGGTGVMVSVSLTGFPSAAEYGPFGYHLHALAVPADGNCTTAGPHLDPTERGELHACEVQAPQTCQAGDLSGKHGNITTPTFTAMYSDAFLSTDPSSPYYIGGKAIVIHSSNSTRLTCANLVQVTNGTSAPNATVVPSMPSATPTIIPSNGAGVLSSVVGVVGGAVALVAAFML